MQEHDLIQHKPAYRANTQAIEAGEDGFHIVGRVEFPFDDIDAALGVVEAAAPDSRQEAAHVLRELVTWCFQTHARHGLRTATVRFTAITAGLRPDILSDRTLEDLAVEVGCTKANLSKACLKFADAFGVKFARSRSRTARSHMARAATGHAPTNIRKKQAQCGKA